MLELETDTIIRTTGQRTIGAGDGVALKDVLAADIPHPIKTFFRADVESILIDELRNSHKTSRFNFQQPEVVSLQSQINSIVVLHYSFRRSEFLQRLDSAVHMLVNFLIRPQWTLASVLFEQDQTISSPMLARLLRHFGPYEYLRNLITHYIREKNITSFNRVDFSNLVWRMDGEYIRRKAGDELARVMSPIYDFFDYPKNTGANALPTKALIRYFEDKGLSTVISRLEGEASQGKQDFTLRVLGEVLEEVRRTSGAFEVDAWDAQQGLGADSQQQQSASLRQEQGASAQQGQGRNARQDQEASSHQVQSANLKQGQGPNPKQEQGASSRQDQGANSPRSGQLIIGPSFGRPPAVKRGSAILASMGEGDQRRFIKKIFRQDEPSFKSAIDAIGMLPSWKDASKFIDEIFIKNDVDPYSSEAEQFIRQLSQQFQPKK